MENVADALKMAGSVLLFVMALSICVLSFSQARESVDNILAYSDRESLYIENDDRFYYLSSSSDTNRYVGKETIIPAIYRSYKESYKIVFNFPDNTYYLFERDGEEVNYINLETESIAKGKEEEFLNGIIYGDFENGKYEFIRGFNYRITPNVNSLYNYLTDKESNYKIKESLGTYYIQDLSSDGEQYETDNDSSANAILEVNKDERRVITYTFESIT